MRKHLQLWGTRVLSVGVFVFAIHQWGMPLYSQYFTPKETKAFVPTAPVRSGKFIVSFHEIGTLEAEKSVPVATESGGKIIKLVADGTFVKTGATICALDTTDLKREERTKLSSYQDALDDIEREKAKFEILKESNKTEVEQSLVQLEYDKSELARAEDRLKKKQELAKDKLIPRSEVDQADLEVSSKKLAVRKGEMALALKKKDVEIKERQGMTEVKNKQQKANMIKFDLEDTQSQLKKSVIFAPASGLVVIGSSWQTEGRKFKEGDTFHRSQTVCELPDLSSMRAKIKVSEADSPKIKVGMKTLIRLEAIPKQVFHGTIKEISSLATQGNPWEGDSSPGRKNFEVMVALKEANPKVIKPGMTADVEFLCDEIKQACYVPLDSVIEQDGKTFVYIKQKNRYIKAPVTVGKHNDNFVCITKGVKKGQVVTLRDPTRTQESQEAGSSEATEADKAGKKAAAPIPDMAGKK